MAKYGVELDDDDDAPASTREKKLAAAIVGAILIAVVIAGFIVVGPFAGNAVKAQCGKALGELEEASRQREEALSFARQQIVKLSPRYLRTAPPNYLALQTSLVSISPAESRCSSEQDIARLRAVVDDAAGPTAKIRTDTEALAAEYANFLNTELAANRAFLASSIEQGQSFLDDARAQVQDRAALAELETALTQARAEVTKPTPLAPKDVSAMTHQMSHAAAYILYARGGILTAWPGGKHPCARSQALRLDPHDIETHRTNDLICSWDQKSAVMSLLETASSEDYRLVLERDGDVWKPTVQSISSRNCDQLSAAAQQVGTTTTELNAMGRGLCTTE